MKIKLWASLAVFSILVSFFAGSFFSGAVERNASASSNTVGLYQEGTLPACQATSTPTPCVLPTDPVSTPTQTVTNTPLPTSPPTLTATNTATPVNTGVRLVTNPWFSDDDCNATKAGWTEDTQYQFGLSVKKPPNLNANPGDCYTAIRWYYTSHPANVWATISQQVPAQGFSEIDLSYWFVSLGSGQGIVAISGREIQTDPWSVLHVETWEGHLRVWDWSGIITVPLPEGTTELLVEVKAFHGGVGGVKATGIEIIGR